jgi:photosystem II stability/assembly factor-like uncharacterized protein
MVLAAAWSQTDGGGGVFRSTDSGVTWSPFRDVDGQSVRSLAVSRKDPAVLVAGTLEGVYQSTNTGRSWLRISPYKHEEIRNVESVAIDPEDPKVIYAGTWHLPWKTTDGGETWFSIKEGLIDDSDVFAITVDVASRDTLYLGACSGIYKTETGGRLWRKIQGIPLTARRTRALRQDPLAPPTVYAGTTEGLWMTRNGGASWRLMTSPKLIVNEILIDPINPNHLLLATDRAGILQTWDGGETFKSSNDGFSHRQIWQLRSEGALLAAAVRHDKEYGGVFFSEKGGPWKQAGEGLHDQDVLALVRSAQGDWLAGTSEGLFRLNAGAWESAGELASSPKKPLATHVDDLQRDGDQLYAATPSGMLRSSDSGRTWTLVSPPQHVERVAASGKTLLAATHDGLLVSTDGGANWRVTTFPESRVVVHALVLAGRTVYAATGRGLFRSPDLGDNWERHGRGIPLGPVYDVLLDPANAQTIYVASALGNAVYLSRDGGQSYAPLPGNGLHGRDPRRLVFGPARELYVASGNDGLFLWLP